MLNMNYNDFLTRQQQIKKLSIAEQKNFYEQLLKKKYDKTEVRILASFYYGQLFYQEGNFRKTIEIIEPIIVDYQSYPYTPKLLSCFNLIGVATHCETEYNVSRFFYETALKIAMENDEKYYYAFEYNNIALTYIEEQNYEEALKSLTLAEDVLKDCDEEMGAYIYINKSISLQKLNRLTEALKAFELGVSQYHADTIVPDDVQQHFIINWNSQKNMRLTKNRSFQKWMKCTRLNLWMPAGNCLSVEEILVMITL